MLWEHDRPGAASIGLIDTVKRYALDQGRQVVLEGILYSRHYGAMLTELTAANPSRTHHFYLDVSLEETLARHRTRPQATEFGPDDISAWYVPRDLLTDQPQTIIAAESTVDQSVATIMEVSGLPPDETSEPGRGPSVRSLEQAADLGRGDQLSVRRSYR